MVAAPTHIIAENVTDQARDIVAHLPTPARSTPIQITSPSTTVTVPAELADLIERIIRDIAAGKSVSVTTMPDELTTTVAAKELGISRPTLMRLIADGELASHKVGTHTRVKTRDVQAFRERRIRRQRDALGELVALSEELGEN